MDVEDIRRQVESYPRWHYQFDLKGVKTPIFRPDYVNRHVQRWKYFGGPLVAAAGGTLAGKRVLDLGCNAGYWSLRAIEAGADHVVAVDGRQMHLDQFKLVFDVHEVPEDRYTLHLDDIYKMDHLQWGQFDVVLCLGFMYHVSKPMELLERISDANSDLLLTDTHLSMAPGSWLQTYYDPIEDPKAALDYSLVFYPTRQAVVDMARQFGYDTRVLAPTSIQDWTGLNDYRTGKRRAFLSAKKTDLSGVQSEPERTPRRSLPDFLARETVRAVRRKVKGDPNRT